jgi:hypothetical protein
MGKNENEQIKIKMYLNWEDIVHGLSAVFQDSLGRSNANRSLMRGSNGS